MLNKILRTTDSTERCGLILNDDTVVEVKNIAREPEESFEMDPTAVLPFLTRGEIAGTWHTHPKSDPQLSGEDYQGFMGWPDLKHYIIGKGGVVKCYKIENGAIFECA